MKCRKLGSIPLEKHNFTGAIFFFKFRCIKVRGGIVLSGGYRFPVAPVDTFLKHRNPIFLIPTMDFNLITKEFRFLFSCHKLDTSVSVCTVLKINLIFGFLSWKITVPECGAIISQSELSSRNGTITSPNYPNNYTNNLNCTWTLRPNWGTYKNMLLCTKTLPSVNSENVKFLTTLRFIL